MKAARQGQTRRVEAKLKDSPSPNLLDYRDEVGLTALHWASFRGHADIVQILWKAGADINAGSRMLGTPLCAGALNGELDVVRLLLGWRVVCNIGNGMLGSPMHAACFSGDVAVVQLLLIAFPSLINKKVTVCFDAFSQIFNGLDYEKGKTHTIRSQPLYIAAWRGKRNVVKLLIENGAAIDAMGREDSCKIDRQPAFNGEVLDQTSENITALMIAIYREHFKTVKELLNQRANPNIRDIRGRTPLMAAAASSNTIDFVSTLLQHNAHINAVDGSGHTAIMHAAFHGNQNPLRTLIRASASVRAKGKDGRTAFDIAAAAGHVECARILQSKQG